MEASNAKDTLQSEPAAAGAYDRVPFASASAIFTMDTSNDIFLLHSIQVWFPIVHLGCKCLPLALDAARALVKLMLQEWPRVPCQRGGACRRSRWMAGSCWVPAACG